MANVTLKGLHKFPVGATVKAYPVTNWPAYQRDGISGAPAGAEAASAVVAANGDIAFTGLTQDAFYVAWMTGDVYVRFAARP